MCYPEIQCSAHIESAYTEFEWFSTSASDACTCGLVQDSAGEMRALVKGVSSRAGEMMAGRQSAAAADSAAACVDLPWKKHR